jgi:hypothetical protein
MKPVSMSTAGHDIALDAALAPVPAVLRDRLVDRYQSLKHAYVNGQFDACGLRAGRLCEILIRALQHELLGSHTPLGTKLRAFDVECAALENTLRDSGPESLRIIIPRALNFLYTLRNKRGFGHEGGEIDANEIDAATAVRVADWCIAELIRSLNAIPLEDGQALLDAIATRELPQVWTVGGVKRVLARGLNYRDQTLLLLYSDPDSAVPIEDLCSWVEHRHLPYYRRDVIARLHQSRLVEYDRGNEVVTLSPTGAAEVDNSILPKIGVVQS